MMLRVLHTPQRLAKTPSSTPSRRVFVRARQSDDESGVNWDEGNACMQHAPT